jgi:hypothetical protein
MKSHLLSFIVYMLLISSGLKAQLIGGDVNKPVNQVYELAAVNYGTPAKPTFTVTAPTACNNNGSITISWSSGTTVNPTTRLRYFAMHNAMDFNGNLLYPCSPSPCPPASLALNSGNSFTATYNNLAPGIYTFGVHRDPNDDHCNNQVNMPFDNLNDDLASGGWLAGPGDQNRCAVVGITLLPVNSNNLTTCNISYINASNCTTPNGSVTIFNLPVNTDYQTSHLVNGAWSGTVNTGSAGAITISNLLTGIYPVRIRRTGELCYRQFNIKVGNNSGIECFADNQLLDPSLGTTLVTNGDFGVTAAAMPTNGTTDYAVHGGGAYGTYDQSGPGDSRYCIDDTTDLRANGVDTTNLYTYRLRYNRFSRQNGHLWNCIQWTGDHTGSNSQNNGTAGAGQGYMMIVNANYRTDRALNISNMSLTAGRSYVFSFWGKNMQPFMPKNKNNGTSLSQTYQPIIPRLAMAVNGIIYDFADLSATLEPTYTATTVLNQMGWEQYNLRFIAPVTNTNSNITIYNFQQGGFGNDFALDDVQLLALSVIGDRIWNDLNRNGIQDLNEPGMANVSVTLLDASNRPLQTTMTDAFGYYQFANISPAALPSSTQYRIQFYLPSGYSFSPQTGGGGAGNATDSDPDPVTGITPLFSLSAGESEMDIDCGLMFDQPLLPSSIGDIVWFDADSDGIQDANESGLANVTVVLYNSSGNIVTTTVTNASGFYRFDNVAPGTYTIGITQPAGTICTGKDLGGNDNSDSDINNSGTNIRRTDNIIVPANTQITNVDIGIRLMPTTTSSFGDLCWIDVNGNGIQAPNEPGLPGVKVVLCQPGADLIVNTADDIRLDSVFTDVFGKWQFTNMATGRYYVRFTPPSGYSYTVLNAGTDEALDSDVLAPGITAQVAINNSPNGFNYQVLDVGFIIDPLVPNATSIGDFFWNDIDGDGVQDASEFGVPGITVELLNSGGTVIATTTTDLNGYYLFTNIPPNPNYRVRFSNIPPGYQISLKDQGGNDSRDSDIDISTGLSDPFTQNPNMTRTDMDGAIRQVLFTGNATVGGIAWYDYDNDGIQDINEIGIPDQTVVLRNAGPDGNMNTGDDIVRTVITNSLGQYIFNGLQMGLYRLEFTGIPLVVTLSAKDAGGDDNLDSDGNTITSGTSLTDNFRLLFGEDRLNFGLGLVPGAAINRMGNRVWSDKNANGIQDTGENLGVQSVVVQLLNTSGNLIDRDIVTAGIQPYQTVSNSNGYWGFVGLPNGTYIPRFSYLPPGFRLSPSKIGTNNNVDSDVFGNGRSAVVVNMGPTLPAVRVNDSIDLGLVPQSAVLGDLVWDDMDGDGIQDSNEPGIVSATATVFNAADVPLGSAVTDAAGKYYFPNIPPGTYYLRYSNYPIGMQFTAQESNAYATNGSNVNPLTGRTLNYTFNDFGDTLHIDAGLRVVNTANVGNYVWFDINNNGIQEATETPVAGIVVTLLNAGPDLIAGTGDDFTMGTTLTDGNGYFQFIITPTGNNYYIRFGNLPLSSSFTSQNMGSGSNDSRPNPATGLTGTFNLPYGASIQNMDAGIINIYILPVNFEFFTATRQSGGVLLDWKLGQPEQAMKYDVLYSVNGVNFSQIASLPGSFSPNSLKFLHNRPVSGNNFYKIIVTDMTGRRYESEVRLVRYDNDFNLTVYPNPVSEQLYVNTPTERNGLQYRIVDGSGKLMRQGTLTGITQIPVQSMAAGSYLFIVSENGQPVHQQIFVKQ